MEERIYVWPSGLRVATTDNWLPPGASWEDPDEDDGNEDEVTPAYLANFQVKESSPELAEVKAQLALLLAAQQSPSRARLAAQRITPLLHRLVAGTPCIAVWMGMIATFFWNSFRSLDQDSLANLIEVPEEFPIRTVAAALETGVFLVWTLCFRSTIRSAIRKEFEGR